MSHRQLFLSMQLIALFFLASPAPAAECKPRTLARLTGEGRTEEEARNNFLHRTHNACYRACKNRECSSPSERCMHDGLSTNPSDPIVRRTFFGRRYRISAEVTCKCACDRCVGNEDRERRKIVGQIISGVGNSPTEAYDDAIENAQDWCDDNECARFPCPNHERCIFDFPEGITGSRGVSREIAKGRYQVDYFLFTCRCLCR